MVLCPLVKQRRLFRSASHAHAFQDGDIDRLNISSRIEQSHTAQLTLMARLGLIQAQARADARLKQCTWTPFQAHTESNSSPCLDPYWDLGIWHLRRNKP